MGYHDLPWVTRGDPRVTTDCSIWIDSACLLREPRVEAVVLQEANESEIPIKGRPSAHPLPPWRRYSATTIGIIELN
jgi:hypothetical protein